MRRLVPLLVPLFLLVYGEATGAPAAPIDLLWRYGTGGQIRSRPAVGPGGALYAISDDGYLYALSPVGRLVWKHNLGWIVTDCLAVGADGTVYAGLRNDDLVAVNPRGSEIWRVRLDGLPAGDPLTTADGRLYVGTRRGTLYVLSHSGHIEWTLQLPAAITQPLAMDGAGTLYVVAADRRLYALSSWGSFKWSLPFNSAPSAPAIGEDGVVLITTAAGEVSQVTPNGNVAWSYDLGGTPFAPLAGTGTSVPGERSAPQPTAGEEVGRPPAGTDGRRLVAAPASRKGAADARGLNPAVIVATRQGTIASFDGGGRLLWRTNLGTELSGDCLLGRDRITVLKSDGTISTLTLQGAIAGRYSLGTTGGTVLTAGGRLYLGGRDWIIYSVQLSEEAALDLVSPWPEVGHDPAHSGRTSSAPREGSGFRPSANSYDLYLESLFALQTREAFTRILDDVRRRVEKRSLGRDVWFVVPILGRIAQAGIIDPVYENNRLINDFPDLRARAALLLGSLGTLQSSDLLIRLLGRESDNVALAAEIDALGRLGSDPDGAAVRAIAAAFARATGSAPNSRIAAAVVTAFQGISKYEGGLSPAAGGPLVSIAFAGYPEWIRALAGELLSAVMK